MIRLPAINRSTIWYLLVVMTAVSFTWSERLNSIGLWLLIILWLLDKNLIQKLHTVLYGLKTPLIKGITALMWLFVAFHFVGFAWSDYPREAWQSTQVKLSFFVLPLLFAGEHYLNEARLQKLMLIFSGSLVFSFTYGFIWAYLEHGHSGWSAVLNRMNISGAVMHPGYYSNYFALAFVWAVFELQKKKITASYLKPLLIFLVCFLLMALLLLISKTAILFLGCFLIYLLWKATVIIKPSILRWVLFVTGSILFLLISTMVPNVRNRIQETTRQFHIPETSISIDNSTGSRIAAWQAEWILIKANWMFGYGTGEANVQLIEAFKNAGYTSLALQQMHTHNQLLHTWLDLGIIGVLLLLSVFIACMLFFIRRKNALGVWLTILIWWNIITDDMLEIQAGVVFFVFFLCLFLYQREDKGYGNPSY